MNPWDLAPIIQPAGGAPLADRPANRQIARDDLPVEDDDLTSPIPTQLLQEGRDILRRVETGEPLPGQNPWDLAPIIEEVGTGADRMRARGMSSRDPSAANAQAAGEIQSARDEAFIAENPVGVRATKFIQGLPFVGEYSDEAMGLLGGDQARGRARMAQDAMGRARPLESAIWQTAGGVAGTLPLAVAAAPTALAAAPAALGARTVAGAGAGLVAGASEGAVSGYGAGNDGDRVAESGWRALSGGAIGGLVGGIAPAVSAGFQALASHLRTSDAKRIADTLGVSGDAAKAIRQALDGEDMGKAAMAIQRGGPDAMLVEAGPATQALGDAVGQAGGAASRVMADGITVRAEKAAGEMRGVLDASLGKPSGRADLASSIRQGTTKARAKAYDAAYSTPIDYASPSGRRIEDILTRMPAKTGEAAIKKANERMVYDGVVNKQIMAQIGDDGVVRFSEMPNAQQLDYIKRAFDQIANDGKDSITGKLSSDAAFAARIAKDIRNAHAGANPAYRKALRTGMDSIQSEKAVETGYKALLPGTTRESLTSDIRGLNASQRGAAKLGVRQYIDDQTANVRAIMSRPGGTEIGEAMKGLRDLSSRASRDKLKGLLGPKEAKALADEADRLSTAFEIQAAMAQNSKTAVRLALRDSVEQSASPNVLKRLMSGEPLQASKRLAQIFTGSTPEAQEAAKAGIYEEIARALTQTKGPRAERALKVIESAMKGQPMKEERARYLARSVTAALALTASEGGTEMVNSYRASMR